MHWGEGCVKQVWVIVGLAGLAACSKTPPKSESIAVEQTAQEASQASEVPEPTPELKAHFAEVEKAHAAICDAGETPIFGCGFADGKRVAVCATTDGRVEYRFGGDELELTLLGEVWATVPYSGGGEARIKFSNGGTNYFIFSRMVRTNFEAGEPNNPAMSDGVVVERAGEVLSVKVCDGPELPLPVQYFEAERFMETHHELFTDETIRADPE